jgi:hypothetical protein
VSCITTTSLEHEEDRRATHEKPKSGRHGHRICYVLNDWLGKSHACSVHFIEWVRDVDVDQCRNINDERLVDCGAGGCCGQASGSWGIFIAASYIKLVGRICIVPHVNVQCGSCASRQGAASRRGRRGWIKGPRWKAKINDDCSWAEGDGIGEGGRAEEQYGPDDEFTHAADLH